MHREVSDWKVGEELDEVGWVYASNVIRPPTKDGTSLPGEGEEEERKTAPEVA